MRAFYTDRFVLPLPEGHRFPMVKYRRVRERCLGEGIFTLADLDEPPAATWDELALVHDADYLAAVRAGALPPLAQRRIGFPWSAEMVERSRRSTGATIAAARIALAEATARGWGIAANLAGGTHHAYPDHGEGFCVFNDAAVAVRVLQAEGAIRRAVVGRLRRAPGERDGRDLRLRSGRLHLLHPRRAQLPLPQGARLARRRAPRRRG